jgi:nitrogen fixation protein FixH
MPFDSQGVWTRESNTTPTAGTAITVTMHEAEWNGLLTDLNKVPVKDVANTFTASQTIQSDDSGALSSSLEFKLYRNSSSPTAADGLAQIIWAGENASGSEVDYAGIHALIAVTTAGSEEGILSLRTMQNGAYTAAYNIREGLYYQGGADMGAGTANLTHLVIQDGVTAPSSGTGVAKIYVDSSTGDLMVKFADGVTKTLATDT